MEQIELNKIEGYPFIKDSEAAAAKAGSRVPSISDDPINREEEDSKTGWGSMIFNFLKILIFGACVFFYDITSKNCQQNMIFKCHLTFM